MVKKYLTIDSDTLCPRPISNGMRKSFHATFRAGTTALLAFSPLVVFADTRPPGVKSLDEVKKILGTIADWMYTFALIVGIIMFLWGAFLYFTANDDPEKLKKAKSTLIYGVIGLVIAIVATGIPGVIGALLGTT